MKSTLDDALLWQSHLSETKQVIKSKLILQTVFLIISLWSHQHEETHKAHYS